MREQTAAPSSELEALDHSERRDATVLFCDLGGYTAWNGEEEPEEVAAIMDLIRRKAIHTFATHGGIVNQFVGDEVLGLFGVTSSHEDDPGRAVLAALALHAFVREQKAFRPDGTPRPLRLHTGIETGMIYTRVHDPRSGVYEVTGDAVNVAARLRSLAQHDEILVGPTTEARIAPFFALERREPVAVRGKPLPIAPSRVIGASQAVSFFDAAEARGLTAYVNRARERTVLRRAWADAKGGRGGVVAVSGSPGIGKTRLLHEFRNLAIADPEPSSLLVLHGHCLSFGNIAPYHPFIDALLGFIVQECGRSKDAGERIYQYLLGLAGVSNMSARLLAYLIDPESSRRDAGFPLEGGPLRDAIVDALVELITALAQTRPVLVLLEDWHWADEASRGALRQLAKNVPKLRVLILVNYRSQQITEQNRPPANYHIELHPLEPDFTEAMTCGVLGTNALPKGLAHFIHERTLGNPFFMEEICRSLLERGACARSAGTLLLLRPLENLETPSTVQSIVRARVDQLRPRQKRVLRVASTIGPEFGLDLLETLLSHASREDDQRHDDIALAPMYDSIVGTELRRVLAELEAQGLLYVVSPASAGFYRFKHAITQEVVYQGLPLHERRGYHGRIAALLEQRFAHDGLEPQYETLAHHYGLSPQREKAIAYAVLAGDKAWRTFSLEQAERQYRKAIALLDAERPQTDATARRRIDVSIQLARPGLYNPRPELVATLRTSYELAQRLKYGLGACLCLNWISWIEYALGNYEPAIEYGQQFLSAATTLKDDRMIAQALTNLGLARAMATDYDRALEHFEAGHRTRARFTGTAYGYSLGSMAMVHGDRGDFERAHSLIEQASAIANAAGLITLQGPLLIQRGMVECWQGAWEKCIETARAAHSIAERIDGQYILAMSMALEGYASYRANGAGEGLQAMHQAAALLRERAIGLHLSWVYALLAEALARSGRYDDASAAVDEALARAAKGDRLGEATALRVQGVIAGLWSRDIERSERCMRAALAVAERKGSERESTLIEFDWASVMRAHGRGREAKALLRQVLPKLSRMHIRSYVLGA